MIFSRLERLVDPFADSRVEMPPRTTARFFAYFLGPLRGLLVLTLAVSGIAAVSELYIYAFLGYIVDWMSVSDPATFFEDHGVSLLLMAVVVAIIRPASTIFARGLVNLALTPGITNSVRWHNYRYVLRQSLSYFHNDYAGRVSQKVMQT
ncbi:MAG: ABC transporter ATP-binding protein, partial [Proteobacteria bacterium]